MFEDMEKLLPCSERHRQCEWDATMDVRAHDRECPAHYRPAVAQALQSLKDRNAELEAALVDAVEHLEGVAELTWDKRDPCRHVCDEASLMSNEAAERARAALAQQEAEKS